MPIAKELALKILGALAVGGTAVGGGIALKNLSSKKTETENKVPENPGKGDKTETQGDNTPGQDTSNTVTHTEEDTEISKLLEELGLKCGKDNICSLATGKHLSVKHEENTRTLTALPANAAEVGKIKIHKAEDDKKNSTFSIEGGDISPTWGTGGSSSITKLEEFETYEIEEETLEDGQQKKYHFKRKTKALDEKLRILGLTESGCTLPASSVNSPTSTCELNKEKLKAINFEGKTKGSDPTMEEGAKASLKITKLKSDHREFSKYPLGYQFELSGEKQITIPATPKDITKKANVSLEFKIKVTSTDNGPKNLTLEKISQLDRLAAKINLTDCNREAKTCKFPRTGLNVYKSSTSSIKGGNITNYDNQTITFQEDAEGYEGEIKLTVSSSISVSSGIPKGTFGQIPAGDYEIKQQTVDDAIAWYLSKKNGK